MMAKKVKYDFKLTDFVKGIKFKSAAQKREVISDVKNFVLESVLNDVGEGKSPVTGRKFKLLSKDYSKSKKRGNRLPNLELKGDLLDSLKVVKRKRDVLRLTVSQSQQPKADGHNNFTGKSKLPSRKFIPNIAKKESFRPAIKKDIIEIIKQGQDGES
jgi:hypothetical protein